jgi:hypothetical protein
MAELDRMALRVAASEGRATLRAVGLELSAGAAADLAAGIRSGQTEPPVYLGSFARYAL